jgi:hypothetical protein
MKPRKPFTIPGLRVMVATLALPLLMPVQALAQAEITDPAAMEILRKMTDYMGGLAQFTVSTQTTYEDELDSGQRVDYDVSTNAILSRPNKLHSERTGELVSQYFYYNGETLILYNKSAGVYAKRPAPETLEELFDFTREELGLFIPVADLIYSYAFSLLTEGITSAVVVGKADINGVACHHLAFSRPDVDFQVWVADSEQPLPCKYVVTDTETPARVSVSTVMSGWHISPVLSDDMFEFTPPAGSHLIDFMPIEVASQATSE